MQTESPKRTLKLPQFCQVSKISAVYYWKNHVLTSFFSICNKICKCLSKDKFAWHCRLRGKHSSKYEHLARWVKALEGIWISADHKNSRWKQIYSKIHYTINGGSMPSIQIKEISTSGYQREKINNTSSSHKCLTFKTRFGHFVYLDLPFYMRISL